MSLLLLFPKSQIDGEFVELRSLDFSPLDGGVIWGDVLFVKVLY